MAGDVAEQHVAAGLQVDGEGAGGAGGDVGDLADGAGLVGGAVGLALLSTALNTRTAEHLADLSANLTITSQRGQMMMHGIAQMMATRASDPEGAAYKMFSFFLRREALALGYADEAHPINTLRSSREPFENFAEMRGF